jgi:hypothetical protein
MAKYDPEVVKSPQRTLNEGCGFCCSTKGKLSLCLSCKVIHYCSRAHQRLHRETHKASCKKIKDASPYSWELIEALCDVHTKSAVQTTLDQLRERRRLSHDRDDVHGLGPLLLLRLGRIQEAYDTMKLYRWKNRAPHPDDQSFDVFERIRTFEIRGTELHVHVALALLKFKLLQDLRAIVFAAQMTRRHLPVELQIKIQEKVPYTSLIANNPMIIANPRYALQLAETVKTQLLRTIGIINLENYHFFDILLDPQMRAKALKEAQFYDYEEPGSEEQAEVLVRMSYDAWVETPWAMTEIPKMFFARYEEPDWDETVQGYLPKWLIDSFAKD